ncbi:Protein-arginine-phosphatase [subsurface metagenome]
MRVLFVCSGNAHRSPLAEALLKKSRPDIEVDSAGLHVAIPISQEAKRYLSREKAVHYLKRFPESLDSKHLEEYDVIVAMEQRHKDAVLTKCPECENKIIMWNVADPYFMSSENAKEVYQQIKDKVTELANSL